MHFWKMHGLGNDYIVIDNRDDKIRSDQAAQLARQLCDRHFSIGADGLLIVSNSKVADVKMRIFNSDGSEAEMCGNGIRCFAKYCYENEIVRKVQFNVETLAGLKYVWLMLSNEKVTSVKVDMGAPNWNRNSLPMVGKGTCINQKFDVDNQSFRITCLSVGNPHCVLFVNDLDNFPVQQLGSKIENHPAFPKRTNVEFGQILNNRELHVRVWERGCGETLACGTGACAAAAAANKLGMVGTKVAVHLLGGNLQVDILENLHLNGPAEKVFEGDIIPEVLT